MSERIKIVSLLEWLKSATEEQIESTGTTIGMLRQIGGGHRIASPKTAALIELVSAGAVSRQELRQEDWSVIWPELAA